MVLSRLPCCTFCPLTLPGQTPLKEHGFSLPETPSVSPNDMSTVANKGLVTHELPLGKERVPTPILNNSQPGKSSDEFDRLPSGAWRRATQTGYGSLFRHGWLTFSQKRVETSTYESSDLCIRNVGMTAFQHMGPKMSGGWWSCSYFLLRTNK